MLNIIVVYQILWVAKEEARQNILQKGAARLSYDTAMLVLKCTYQ